MDNSRWNNEDIYCNIMELDYDLSMFPPSSIFPSFTFEPRSMFNVWNYKNKKGTDSIG